MDQEKLRARNGEILGGPFFFFFFPFLGLICRPIFFYFFRFFPFSFHSLSTWACEPQIIECYWLWIFPLFWFRLGFGNFCYIYEFEVSLDWLGSLLDWLWLMSFLQDLNLASRVGDPIEIWCNNNFVVQYAKDPKLHRKAKHIKRRYLFVRDAIKLNKVVVKFWSTNEMIAYPWTKPTSREVFKTYDNHHRGLTGLEMWTFVETLIAAEVPKAWFVVQSQQDRSTRFRFKVCRLQ